MERLARGSRALLFVIAVVLVFWALKATKLVSLPLAFGVVLLMFFRPLQKRLDRRLPRFVSIITVVLICLAFLALLGGLLYYGATTVAPEVPRYTERIGSQLQNLENRLQQQGISVSLPGGSSENGPVNEEGTPAENGATDGAETGASGSGVLQNVTGNAFSTIGNFLTGLSFVVLTLTVLTFLLIEVYGFHKKVGDEIGGEPGRRLLDAFDRMAGKFERYFLVQAFTSVLTGLLTWGWCALLGVEFAFVWGLVAFTFNFVPTVGSILAVVPPTLFALAFSGLGTGLGVLAGLTAIQLILGNFVDPALQGKAVQLSPVVVLLAVVFWGWLWGIGGAIIAVPMTIAVTLVFQEFEATRPIAVFLSEPDTVKV